MECPGCHQRVYREYTTVMSGFTVRYHLATQTEHEALMQHWDFCPAVSSR